VVIYFDLEELLAMIDKDTNLKFRSTLVSEDNVAIDCEFYKNKNLYYAYIEYRGETSYTRFPLIEAYAEIEGANDKAYEILNHLNSLDTFGAFKIFINSRIISLNGSEMMEQAKSMLDKFDVYNFKKCEESYIVSKDLYYTIGITKNDNKGVLVQIFFTDVSVPGKSKALANLVFNFVEGTDIDNIRENVVHLLLDKLVNVKDYSYKLANGNNVTVSTDL
jgi:hypothetical protein